MKFAFLIMAAAVLSLLLLGCTGQQASSSQPNSAPSPNPQAPPSQHPKDVTPALNKTNATAAPPAQQPNNTPQAPASNNTPAQPKKSYTCSLTLDPSTIQRGGTTEIGYSVYAESNVKFTYNCGNETLGISTGGLTAGSRLCEFYTPGEGTVWIKADGVVCAEKNLTVLQEGQSQAAKKCWIDETTLDRGSQSYHYAVTVYYEGFSETDAMAWICDNTTATSVLGPGPFGGMSTMKRISCDYPQRPEKDYMEVSIGKTPCGRLSTR